MLDRGLRRSFPPGVERAAQDAAAARRRPPRPHRPADLHHRPGHRTRLRRRDLVRGPRRRALARLGPHRRRLGLRAPRRGGRPRGLPALDLGLRAGRGRADAARGAVERRLLAAPRRRSPGGHRRARAARRADRQGGLLPLAHPLRRAPGLRPRRPDLRRRRGRAGAVGRAARGRARGGGGAPGAPREPRRAGHRVGRARVRLRPPRPPRRGGGVGPDRVAPAHRAPDDRRQRGGGDAARRALDPDALPRPRAPRDAVGRCAWSTSSPRWTSRRRRCPSRWRRRRRPRSSRSARSSSTSTCAAPGTAARR